jgi:DDE superfamily endonuclease
MRPPKARTWSRRGITPVTRVCGKGSGRVHLAGLIAARPGARTRLIYRMITCHGRRGEKKGFREQDLAALLDAARQQLGGPVVLVWDNATSHTDTAMRALITARSGWLTVFRLPAYAPDLNPAEMSLSQCGIRRVLAS